MGTVYASICSSFVVNRLPDRSVEWSLGRSPSTSFLRGDFTPEEAKVVADAIGKSPLSGGMELGVALPCSLMMRVTAQYIRFERTIGDTCLVAYLEKVLAFDFAQQLVTLTASK
jgi:hypothetical protein